MIRTFIGCPDIHSPRPVWSPEAKSLGGLHGQSRRRHPRGEPPAGGRRPQRRRTVGNAFEARGAIDDVWRFSPEPLRVQAVPGFAPVTPGPAVRNRAPLRNTSSDQRIVAHPPLALRVPKTSSVQFRRHVRTRGGCSRGVGVLRLTDQHTRRARELKPTQQRLGIGVIYGNAGAH